MRERETMAFVVAVLLFVGALGVLDARFPWTGKQR